MLRWLTRTSGTLTVLAGLLAVLVLTKPLAPTTEAHASRQETLGTSRTLPADWPDRVLRAIESGGPPMTRRELAGVIEIVEREARRFDVDPLMVLAIIEVESRFDPNAVSPRGAIGLMQLREDTAIDLAADLGLTLGPDASLLAPDLNVTLGTAYLRRLIDRFGSYDAALTAYHAGPTRVEDRLARSAPVSLEYCDRIWKVIVSLQSRSVT